MGRRTRVVLVAAAVLVPGAAVALAFGAPVGIVLGVVAGLTILVAAASSALLDFVDRPLARIRQAAREASRGDGAGRPMVTEHGEAGRLARAVGDLAERVRVAEAATRTQREIAGLLDHLGDGVAVLDGDGRVTRCNDGFREWIGRQDVEGELLASLIRDPDVRSAVSAALSNRHASREVRKGDGIVRVTARPFRDGALVTVRDLTEIRRLERVRRDFVANVSHELKTPLTSVAGFAEALTEGPGDTERVRDFGERILQNARRMRRLVDQLLDLARVEAGVWEPSPETLEVAAAVGGVWRSLPAKSSTSAPSLDVDGATHSVRADAHGLRQIFQNLLDNARRYSPPDGTVTVRTRRRGDLVRIEISDRGPGIPLAHRDRIFERFYRVDEGRARDDGGTGLGLAIVKHLVLAHGGDIGVESQLGRGTTVWFTLPATSSGRDTAPGEDPIRG